MKKVKIICCLFLVIISLSGCGGKTINKKDLRYELIKFGNQSYLVINENINIVNEDIMHSAEIKFDSIESFVDTVTSGSLDDHQLYIANKAFVKDSIGIRVCDFSNIQVPVHPKEFKCKTVFWSGELYSFYLESTDNAFGYYHLLNQEQYENQYNYKYLNYFDRDNVTTSKVVNNSDNTEYYYSTPAGDLKKIRYSITNGQTLLIVDETYRLNMNDESLRVSSDIPYRVAIYGNNGDQYFSIEIFEIDSRPTMEWIKDFNIKRYK